MVNIKPKESDICKHFIRTVKHLRVYKQFKTEFEILHIANEIRRTGNKAIDQNWLFHLLNMGMMQGAADYLMLYEGGRVAAIEFKRDKTAPLRPNQKIFKEHCERLKIPYLCTYDFEEAIDFMKSLLNQK